MKKKAVRWGIVLGCLVVVLSLPWIINSCGSSGGGTTTTHTVTLKGGVS